MKSLLCGFLVNLFSILPAFAVQADVIGHIQTLRGTASVVRGDSTLPAAIGATLNRGDSIRTGKPGAVGIVMTDSTTISLGPNSELSLKEYTFTPKDGKFSLVVRMIKGTFVYLSGQMGRLAPDNVHLLIPDAIIGLRGSKLLVEVQE